MGREVQRQPILVSGSRSVNRIVDRRVSIAISPRKRRGAKRRDAEKSRQPELLKLFYFASLRLCVDQALLWQAKICATVAATTVFEC